MAEYPNSGILGRNKRKEQPNHPDYTGQANIECVDYWISAWIKEGPSGKFFSLSFKPKEASQVQSSKPKGNERTFDGLDDDMDAPF